MAGGLKARFVTFMHPIEEKNPKQALACLDMQYNRISESDKDSAILE